MRNYAVVALTLALAAIPAALGDTIVDTFDDFDPGLWPLTVNSSTPIAGNSQSGVAGVVGGVRNAQAQWTSGPLGVSAAIISPPGVFSLASDALTDGAATLTYPGQGGLNLDVSAESAFVVEVVSSDLGGVPLDVTLTDGSANSATAGAVAAGAQTVSIPLTSFAGVDLSDVDQIDVELNPAQEFDITLDFIGFTTNLGTILVRKVVGQGDPANPGQTFTLNISNAGGVLGGLNVLDGGVFVGLGGLAPGSFAVNEINIPAHWSLDDISCTSQNGNSTFGAFTQGINSLDVTLAAGDEVRCTFTDNFTPPGTIQIIKDTVPDGPQDFSFATTSGLVPSSFDLDDDADGTLPNTQTYDDVAPGIYTISEVAVAGYTTTVNCVDPSGGTTSSGATATIDLASGETVACTFTNTTPDCNTNGLADFTDIAAGTAADCNTNGVPDACDLSPVASGNCNVNIQSSFITVDYIGNNAGGILTASGFANVLTPPGSPAGNIAGGSFDINANINFNAQTANGTLNIGGTVASQGFNSGTLLTGVFASTAANPTFIAGAGDPLEFLFDITGGDAAGVFGGIGATAGVTLSFSGYAGSFAGNFTSGPFQALADTFRVCEIAGGTSSDCNSNGVPDECDPDCNSNGSPDDCDVTVGTSDDCNNNVIPDTCDLAVGTSDDCNSNGVSDECDPDCNSNGSPDDCDVTSGTSEDCNTNGVPDECDIARATSDGCNVNVNIESAFINVDYVGDNNGGVLTASGFAQVLTPPGSPAGNIAGGSFDINANVNFNAQTAAGTLTIGGTVASQGFNSGTLLTGTFSSTAANPTFIPGAGDPLEFLFDINGGDAAGVFGGIGATAGVTLSQSGYAGSFANDFSSAPFGALADTFGVCDIAAGTSSDCNANLIPDECDPDCNTNGSPDDCDLINGSSVDLNNNNQPDECDSPPMAVCDPFSASASANCCIMVTTNSIDGGSFDPDPGDMIRRCITAVDGVPVPDMCTTAVEICEPGLHTCELTVFDLTGAADTCTSGVTVVDDTPPDIGGGVVVLRRGPGLPLVFMDDNCVASTGFNVTITDNCCVDTNSIMVTPQVPANVTLRELTFDIIPLATNAVQVVGEIVVEDLQPTNPPTPGSITTIGLLVESADCAGSNGIPLLTEFTVGDRTLPQISAAFDSNGPVAMDDNCVASLGFTAMVTDNCCIDTGGITITPQVHGNASIQRLDVMYVNVSTNSVMIVGELVVQDMTQPANPNLGCITTIGLEVSAQDCALNIGIPAETTTTVADLTPPEIVCPDDIVYDRGLASCPALTPAQWLASATATDNCTLLPVITNDANSVGLPCGGFPCDGDNVVTFTATDDCMNQTSCQATLTVIADHPGWNNVDVGIDLTANQPTYWSALTGGPSTGGVAPFPILDPGCLPGRKALDGSGDRVLRGYIVAWAVDANGNEIRWNHLKGDAVLVNYDKGTAWEYTTYAFAVVNGVANGAPTGITPGQLDLDGNEYDRGFGLLLLDFYASGSQPLGLNSGFTLDTDLTLLPLDVDLRQETGGPVTTKASFTIWNQNEVKFTGLDRCITCWDQTLLSQYGVPNHFLGDNLQTNKGKAQIDGLASQVCDVDFDPGDACTQTTGGPDPTCDPRDILSQSASLIGVAAKQIAFGPMGPYDAAGMNLVGMGFEDATIQADISGGPPPERFEDVGATGPRQQRGRQIAGDPLSTDAAATALAATDRASASEKGSLLVFPKVELRWNALGNTFIRDTFIDLTNDYPDDVQVQMYFINGDAAITP